MENRMFFHGRDADLADGFLSDMDEEPVDMEEIREGMKLVPLPDMCYTQGEIDRDACFPSFDDIIRGELQASNEEFRLVDDEPRRGSQKAVNKEDQAHSGEADGTATAKAAKVAAEVAPNVLTGGIVAETGPPPDFSLWTVEDDLLLKNAMEAGAAMEALAKGAMRFSRRYTVKELRERWRALLYDPEISAKAAVRMVEAEAAFIESMRLMFPNKHRLQDFVQKRRQNSVRATYYKRKKGLVEDKLVSGHAFANTDGDTAEMHGYAHGTEALGLEGSVDADDHTFSQMVSLLATGGVEAVIGELPAVSGMDLLQSDSHPDKVLNTASKDVHPELSRHEFSSPSDVAADKILVPKVEQLDELQETAGCKSGLQGRSLLTAEAIPSVVVASTDVLAKSSTIELKGLYDSPHEVSKVGDLQNGAQAVSLQATTGLEESKEMQHGMADNLEVHSEQYLLESSDDGDDTDLDHSYLQEPKRPCLSNNVVQENLMCTFNTQETEIPAFGNSMFFSSPSSEHRPSSPEEEGRGDATSDFKSSHSYDLSDRDERQSIEVASQLAEAVKRPSEDRYPAFSTSNVGCAIANGSPAVKPQVNLEGTAGGKPKTEDRVSSKEATSSQPVVEVPAPSSWKLEICSSDAFIPPQVEATTSEIDPAVDEVLPDEIGERQGCADSESDDAVAHFSDVEAMILDMDLDPGDDDFSARAESKRFYRQHRRTILRLEQSASSAMQRSLTLKGAIAIFYGRHLKYHITKDEVSIGRGTQDNVVDIDLGQEGRANKVSRRQASIKLKEDGVYYLKNIGRRILHVNNVVVDTGQRAGLNSNCLIEAGGMQFIFEINRKLTNQRVKEMLHSGYNRVVVNTQ